ncbi:MAG: Calx-beta domain-containing protein, partial [Burkholderiales bacterium]
MAFDIYIDGNQATEGNLSNRYLRWQLGWIFGDSESLPVPASVTLGFSPRSTASAGTDYSTELQVSTDGGTTWVAYSPGSSVSIPVGSTSMLARTLVIDDRLLEGEEAVILDATMTAGAQGSSSASGEARITDTDLPDLTVVGNSATEANGGFVQWTISLSEKLPAAERFGTARLTLAPQPSSTATADVDYSQALEYSYDDGASWTAVDGDSIELDSNYQTLKVRAAILDDAAQEANETVVLGATLSLQGRISTNASGTAVILDNDTASELPSVAIAGSSVAEGAGNFAQWSIALGSPMPVAGNLALSFGAGTATAGTDFSNTLQVSTDNGTSWTNYSAAVSVPANTTRLLVRAAILDDAVYEASETVVLNATLSATGRTSSTGTGSVTITETDLPGLSISGNSVNEAAGNFAQWTVNLGSAMPVAGSLALSFGAGTASAGADFGNSLQVSTDGGTNWVSYSSALAIPANTTSLLVRAAILDDAAYEANETVVLNATLSATGRTSSTGTGSVSITETDLPGLSITGNGVNEATGNFAQWTVNLGAAMPVAGSLALSLGSGTATAGTDFSNSLQVSTDGGTNWVSYSAALAIPANTTSLLVRAAILDDSTYETSETVVLNATLSATGRTSSTGTGSVTITETDLPGLSITGNSVNEATGNFAQWTVALGSAMPVAGSLALSFGSGTAAGGTDFSSSLQVSTDGGTNWVSYSSALAIPANTTSLLVRAAILDDSTYEASETVVLNATLSATGRTSSTGTGSVTITETDLPGLSITGNSVNEATGNFAQWTVALGSAMPVAGSLALSFGSGTAAAGTDFSSSLQVSTDGGTNWVSYSSALAIPANTTSLLVRAAILDDSTYEANETVVLNATLSATGRTSSTGTGSVTITETDLPGLSISGNSVNEAAGNFAQWTVALGSAMPVAGSLALSFGSGTATAGTDFTNALEVSTNGGSTWTAYSSSLAIPANTTSLLVRAAILNDSLSESTESIVLEATLSAQGRTSSTATGTVVLLDDDAPLPGLSITGNTVAEAAGNFAQWTVALGSAMPVAGSLALSFGSGTAAAGTDFSSSLQVSIDGGTNWVSYSSALAIPANTTSLLVRAAILDDSTYEANETVVLNAALSATGRTSSTGTGSVTITETDLPGLSITGNSVNEAAGNFAQWTVALGAAMPVAGSLALSFGSGTAAAGTDFSSSLQVSIDGGTNWVSYSSALAIPANTTSLLVRAAILDDSTYEANETVVLNAALSATGRTSSTGTGSVTITETDLPGLSITGNSVNEAAGNFAQWTVALGAAMPVAGSLALSFGSGTATAGADFTNALEVSTNGGSSWSTYSSALVIPSNTTSLLVRAAILDDAVYEASETVVLNATLSATGRTSSTGTGSVTITETDLPGLSITGNSVNEAAGNFAQWTVALGSAMPVAGSLALSFGAGTASAGSDFGNSLQVSTDGGTNWVSYSSALSIPANTTSLLVRAAILDDAVYEASETVVLNATLSAVGRTSSTGTGSVTITETDLPGLSITGNNVNEAAGNFAQWTVALGSAMPVAGSLALSFGSGTAAAGTDFSSSLQVSIDGGTNWVSYSSALAIPANTTSLLVRAAILDDSTYEANETVVLNATLSATGRTSSTGTGSVTITETDLPGLSITGNSVNEAAGNFAQWTVALGAAMPVAGS